MFNRIKNSVTFITGFILLAMAFMTVQSASAMPIEIRELTIKVDVQPVDTDGDGSLETFSADYVVRVDGTAEGFINLDKDSQVSVNSGHIEQHELTHVVQSGGSGVHQNGHKFTAKYQYDPNAAFGGDGEAQPIKMVITDETTGQSQTIEIMAEVIAR